MPILFPSWVHRTQYHLMFMWPDRGIVNISYTRRWIESITWKIERKIHNFPRVHGVCVSFVALSPPFGSHAHTNSNTELDEKFSLMRSSNSKLRKRGMRLRRVFVHFRAVWRDGTSAGGSFSHCNFSVCVLADTRRSNDFIIVPVVRNLEAKLISFWSR